MPGDDELSVDFSKVGDWFTRKKKTEPKADPAKKSMLADKHATAPHTPTHEEHHAHPPASVEKNDEDIAIDFKKIAGWFSKKGASPHNVHDVAGKDELSFEFGSVWGWIKKHPVFIVLAVLLILQFVPNQVILGGKDWYMPWGGMHMRMRNQGLPGVDGWATNHVYGILKGQLSNAVNQQYPNLPDERKNKIIEDEWQKLYKQQGPQIEQQVQIVAQQIKSYFQYEVDGRTYTHMPDIDPYQWLRYVRNLDQKGILGDELKNGKPWDWHVLAPLGGEIVPELQPFVMFWLYKVMHVFDSKIPIMQAVTYFPIVIILLSLIPAFFIGRRFAGTAGGIAAATMIAVMPSILVRTTWGHPDTDPWNVFFPLLLTWLYFILIESESWKRMLGWGALAGFVTGLYAFAWRGGYWYTFDSLLGAFGILVLSELLQHFRQPHKLVDVVKRRATQGIAFVASSGIFVSLFMTSHDFFVAVLQPIRFAVIKAAAHPTLWPNVYTTVAELNPTNIAGVVSSMGGGLYFWIAIAGIAFLLFKRSDSAWKLDLKYAPLFVLWFIGGMYASTKGVRFTLILAPAFAVVFGIALGKFYRWATVIMTKDLKVHAKLAHGVMIVVLAFLLSNPAHASHGAGVGDLPLVNDAWWAALTAIKDDSKQNAIINSWWDFGHHFKYIADRAVTFDGASQNTPMAHWIGRALATSNETEAVGILRMLDCGSNSAFEVLNKQFNDPVKSVKLLYKIIGVDKKAALAILAREGVNEQELVLKYTHCDPPENYFIASDDMIGKSGVWSHFGLWDFERAKLWIVLRNQDQTTAVQTMMREWNYTEEQAEQAYFEVQSITDENAANAWISPWPGILGGATDCSEKDKVVRCGNGFTHNTTSGETTIVIQGTTAKPVKLVRLLEDGRFAETKYNDTTVGVAALLYPTGPGTYKNVIASPELITSMFVRQYFLEGHGLRHFKEFNRQQLITGGQIITYKVNWKGSDPHEFSGLKALKEGKATQEKEKSGAKEGDQVTVQYTGALVNGSVFDSSIKDWKKKNVTIDSSFDGHEHSALTFTIGTKQVIEGFDAAVLGMDVGEEQIVQIPPNAAYGFDPKKHFLGNQTLRFKILLVTIEPKV